MNCEPTMLRPTLLLRQLGPARICHSKYQPCRTLEAVQIQLKTSFPFSSTCSAHTKQKIRDNKNKRSHRELSKKIVRGLVGVVLMAGVGIILPDPLAWLRQMTAKKTVFSAPAFTPFTIINKEDVSPTCTILTLIPSTLSMQGSTPDPYKKLWERGTWSVEFKQPELQIARSYTPLPPTEKERSQSGTDYRNGQLKFLIRKEEKGEVSNYLHNLPIRAQVDLRGPHIEFEFDRRKSDLDFAARATRRNVVFLAGGTGIAPALQLAHTMLERKALAAPGSKMYIFWANRRREDCEKGLVMEQLQALEKKYPEQLCVDYLVDEEGSYLDRSQISNAVAWISGYVIEDEKSTPTLAGLQNYVVVSGPEGFVEYFAGPKVWKDGKQQQGQTGGVLGQMGLQGWKVWKL